MRRPVLSERHARYTWIALGLFLTGFLIYVSWKFIGTLVISLFFYYATRPFYRIVLQYIDQPTLAALIAISIVTLPVLLLLLYTISIAYKEFRRLDQAYDVEFIEDYIGLQSGQIPSLDTISKAIQSPEEALRQGLDPELVQSLLDATLQSIEFVGSVALSLFIVLVFTFYLLRDGHRLMSYIKREFNYKGSVAEDFIVEVDYDFHKVFFGNILNAVVTGIIASITFASLDLIAPTGYSLVYPTLLGLLCGIASLIPVVGMKLVYVPVATYLFALMGLNGELSTLGWFPVLFVGASAIIVDAIPDFFLRPYISGRNLHVGALMLAYIIGPVFFGWYGLFLGPMMLVLIFEFGRIVLPRITTDKIATLPPGTEQTDSKTDKNQDDTPDNTES